MVTRIARWQSVLQEISRVEQELCDLFERFLLASRTPAFLSFYINSMTKARDRRNRIRYCSQNRGGARTAQKL
jgi:hypothetical protein